MKPGNFQDTGYKKDTFREGYPRQKEIRMRAENNFYLRISLLC